MNTVKCTTCNLYKNEENFYKRSDGSFRLTCKECKMIKQIEYRKKKADEQYLQDEIDNNLLGYSVKKCSKHGRLLVSQTGLVIHKNLNPIRVDLLCLLCRNDRYAKDYSEINISGKEGFIVCYVCKGKKDIFEFQNSELKRKFPCCRSCISIKNIHVSLNGHLKRNYNITLERYNEMFSEQDGKCKICNQSEKRIHPKTKIKRRLTVDHNHETGAVRSLTCANCNSLLGMANDNPEILRSAAKYLEDHA